MIVSSHFCNRVFILSLYVLPKQQTTVQKDHTSKNNIGYSFYVSICVLLLHTSENISFFFQNLIAVENVCISNPCRNGGACADDHGKYTCSCKDKYSGVNCEIGEAGNMLFYIICFSDT